MPIVYPPLPSAATRSARRLLLGDVGLALLSGLVASVLGAITLQVWHLDLGAPMRYTGDAIQILGYVQDVLETGWYLSAPRLGAPFGQSYYDFPLGAENLHFPLLRVLAGITGDAAATVAIFYLLTLPLVAVAAFWSFRHAIAALPDCERWCSRRATTASRSTLRAWLANVGQAH